jgi:hypothetical protein
MQSEVRKRRQKRPVSSFNVSEIRNDVTGPETSVYAWIKFTGSRQVDVAKVGQIEADFELFQVTSNTYSKFGEPIFVH